MGEETMNEFGLVTKHLNCGMDSEISKIPEHSERSIDSTECCQNQFELLQNDVEQSQKDVQLTAAHLIFITAFSQSFIFGVGPVPSETFPRSLSSPPLIKQDFTILYQTFLI